MRVCEITHSNLLPIQDYLDCEKVAALRTSERPLPPIVAMPLGYKYVILDGHHRTAAHYRRGEIATPARLIESDADVLRIQQLGFAWLQSRTIDQLVDAYLDEWRTVCDEAGIESFYDLLLRCKLA